jgi:transporter family-2 protein
MDRGAAVVLTAAAGGLIALQAPINGMLGTRIGSLQAAFLSFCIGTVALLALAALADGGLGRIADVKGIGWGYLTGGLLGAVYVTTVLTTVGSLGAGGVVAATVAGQLTIGVLVDRFGWLGVVQEPITTAKLAGIVLLAAGVALIVRE